MAEGDTIASFAQAMRPWLEGQEVLAAQSRRPRVVQGLVGCVVLRLETVGKHMLIRMSDGTTLRIHLKMTGSWHRYDPGESWSRSRGDLALALETREHQVVCFKAPDVVRIDERALANHPILAVLGRDLMAENADLDEVLL